jgi:hypothetical protein
VPVVDELDFDEVAADELVVVERAAEVAELLAPSVVVARDEVDEGLVDLVERRAVELVSVLSRVCVLAELVAPVASLDVSPELIPGVELELQPTASEQRRGGPRCRKGGLIDP